MSELIASETHEDRTALDLLDVAKYPYARARTPLDTKFSLWSSDRKVSVVTSRLVAGRPRTAPEKRWYKWRTVKSEGFYRAANGYVMPYSCIRPWDAKVAVQWEFHNSTSVFDRLDGEDAVLAEQFAQEVWKRFAVKQLSDIYPMAQDIPKFEYVPQGIRNAYRAENWADFATTIFGKKRTDARLTDAVAIAEPYIIAYAHQFRGWVNDLDIVKLLSEARFDEDADEAFPQLAHSPKIRKTLAAMHKHGHDTHIPQLFHSDFDVADLKALKSLSQTQWVYSFRAIERRIDEGEVLTWAGLERW